MPKAKTRSWRRPFGLTEPRGSEGATRTGRKTERVIIDIRYRHRIKEPCVIRPASRDMRIDARSGNTNHGAAQRSPKASTNDDILTGKVLTNSSRMSSLHDLVKNRPFTANCEVQTCLFLSKDFPLNYNTNGGAERDRTADPLLAKQVLSQLSYSPILVNQ